MTHAKPYMILLLMLAALLALTGCGSAPAAQTEPADESLSGTAPEETQGIAVDNAYMTFYYPQEWEGKVEELREENGKNFKVSFQTKIGEKNVVLFSIVLGPDVCDGYLLGQLKDPEAGTINVYSIINEPVKEDWSEEEYSEICALQERVNDIIVQFYDDDRFVPSR